MRFLLSVSKAPATVPYTNAVRTIKRSAHFSIALFVRINGSRFDIQAMHPRICIAAVRAEIFYNDFLSFANKSDPLYKLCSKYVCRYGTSSPFCCSTKLSYGASPDGSRTRDTPPHFLLQATKNKFNKPRQSCLPHKRYAHGAGI